MSEIFKVRSRGAILDIDVISGDLKQSNLKSDRFLKHENSDFVACSEERNPTPFTLKINIFKEILAIGSWVFAWKLILDHYYTAAFTYYYDPAILRNKLTPLSIFRDLALRKRDSKKIIIYFYVFYRMYTNIPKLYRLVVYSFMNFLGDSDACVRFGIKTQ